MDSVWFGFVFRTPVPIDGLVYLHSYFPMIRGTKGPAPLCCIHGDKARGKLKTEDDGEPLRASPDLLESFPFLNTSYPLS